MYCGSCGGQIARGKGPCEGCGAPAAPAYVYRGGGSPVTNRARGHEPLAASDSPARGGAVRMCPGCGYPGDGVPYFRRTSHAALLAAVSLLTYGLGGLFYWRMKRNARVCPSCGLGWERARPLERLPGGPPAKEWDLRLPRAGPRLGRLPRGGLVRRTLGVLMAPAALLCLVLGVVEASPPVVALGVLVGLLGALSFAWGRRALQGRRAGLLRSLQARTLRMAEARGGRLTATELASDLQLTLPAAERVLFSMDDGFRVSSEVTDEGLLVFDFPEILLRSLTEGESRRGTERMED